MGYFLCFLNTCLSVFHFRRLLHFFYLGLGWARDGCEKCQNFPAALIVCSCACTFSPPYMYALTHDHDPPRRHVEEEGLALVKQILSSIEKKESKKEEG